MEAINNVAGMDADGTKRWVEETDWSFARIDGAKGRRRVGRVMVEVVDGDGGWWRRSALVCEKTHTGGAEKREMRAGVWVPKIDWGSVDGEERWRRCCHRQPLPKMMAEERDSAISACFCTLTLFDLILKIVFLVHIC
ncbi:hypothetical protein Salat_2662800 [Sesamum alatum]|uniref:Uncharacterized protein n=1 Tax=Sesamum alatum TaxID=300844 RepID=A0AAE1XPB8_9LAMI|nr:hypothetical protein Salat_2662800 [Sesamum alatum]